MGLSVGLFVGRSVSWYVGWSVNMSVSPTVVNPTLGSGGGCLLYSRSVRQRAN